MKIGHDKRVYAVIDSPTDRIHGQELRQLLRSPAAPGAKSPSSVQHPSAASRSDIRASAPPVKSRTKPEHERQGGRINHKPDHANCAKPEKYRQVIYPDRRGAG